MGMIGRGACGQTPGSDSFHWTFVGWSYISAPYSPHLKIPKARKPVPGLTGYPSDV